LNISTRSHVLTGDNVLIGGFIVTGNAPKDVIVRAIGPSLKVNGVPVPGRLQDPTLELHDAHRVIGSNDNWQSDQEQAIKDSKLPPSDPREAAIRATLQPGDYTAIVRGKNNTTGIALVEVYDLDHNNKAELGEIATRGKVETGDNVMIGGFILSGPGTTKVLLRAIGPELTARGVSGALQDPTLELRDHNGVLLAANDDWRSSQEQEISATKIPPKDNRESAILKYLSAGGYTAIVRGKNGTTGLALVEVYALSKP
jgi:hypothetical protein